MNVQLVWWKQPESLAQPSPVVVFYPPAPQLLLVRALSFVCSRTNSLICQSNILYIWEIKTEKSAKKAPLLQCFVKVFSTIQNVISGAALKKKKQNNKLEKACLG